ncbi:MAG: DUF2149 domain-containing protein [Coriobacteriales bacterium]|jgi:hypothetical protein|nr:DUF2149 domain-containing protein [Coriobacteriales bacterium]
MAYDFGDGDLRGGALREDAQPDAMAGMANLADVMLVFACGLMLALVTYWNLDLPSITELDSEQMHELDESDEIMDILGSSSAYIEKGTVYQDPSTGKLYWMIAPEEGGE